jgi:enoyl-CoA hydratase/carnithine racemase
MYVDVERPDPAVALIRLNRPERMNAMSFDVMVPFREALLEAGADTSVRAVAASTNLVTARAANTMVRCASIDSRLWW